MSRTRAKGQSSVFWFSFLFMSIHPPTPILLPPDCQHTWRLCGVRLVDRGAAFFFDYLYPSLIGFFLKFGLLDVDKGALFDPLPI